MNGQFDLYGFIRDVFNPQPNERVLIVRDRPHGALEFKSDWQARLAMSQRWADAFRSFKTTASMLDFEATGTHGRPLPPEGCMDGRSVTVEREITNSNIVLAFTQFSATSTLTRLIRDNKRTLRGASLPGVLERMEQSALAADYARVAQKAHEYAEKLTAAVTADVSFPTGHSMRFDLRHRIAKADDGRCVKPGMMINLPSGEAFIVPYEGEEGEASETAGEIPYANTQGDVAVLTILRNRIVAVTGDSNFAADRRAFFAGDRGRRNVAELGLGCNDRAVVTGNTLEDEKAGFHWAYGLSYHFPLGVISPDKFDDPQNAVHQDLVYARGCPIHVMAVMLTYPDGSSESVSV